MKSKAVTDARSGPDDASSGAWSKCGALRNKLGETHGTKVIKETEERSKFRLELYV